MTAASDQTVRVVAVSAGTGEPSSTRLLADRLAAKLAAGLRDRGDEPQLATLELAPLAQDIAAGMVSGVRSDALETAIAQLAAADVVVISTPVYKAGISGLLKSFADLLDNDLLLGKPVVLAATAGTARHALVVDDQLRQLMAYFRAVSVPTSVFAAPEDWNDPALTARIERAATEAAVLQRSAAELQARTWAAHKHDYGSGAAAPSGHGTVNFDTDLMCLAAGGQ